MYDDRITNEFLEELSDLASWEGCELGDLANNLSDMYQSYASYSSNKFQRSLVEELLEIHSEMKTAKAEEDEEEASNKLQTVMVIVLNGQTTHYETDTEANSLEDLPKIMKEYLARSEQ